MSEMDGIDMVFVFADVELSAMGQSEQAGSSSEGGGQSAELSESHSPPVPSIRPQPSFSPTSRDDEGSEASRTSSDDSARSSDSIPPSISSSLRERRSGQSGFVATLLPRPRAHWGDSGTQSSPPSTQPTVRGVPPGIERILQRAFTHISGQHVMTEFMRTILEGHRRGNPPASRFAMDNLESSTCSGCDPCTICQDDIHKGCEAVHMPCKHAFHRECLVPWLEEHNTCPVCRCEVESQCPRYNQMNFDKLKGPLQPTTVSNHENPSQLPPSFDGFSSSISGAGSHLRMTIRMPFASPQRFERPESSSSDHLMEPLARPAARVARHRASLRPNTSRLGGLSSGRNRSVSPPTPPTVEVPLGKRRGRDDLEASTIDEDPKSAVVGRDLNDRKRSRPERAAAQRPAAIEVCNSEESPIASRTRNRRPPRQANKDSC